MVISRVSYHNGEFNSPRFSSFQVVCVQSFSTNPFIALMKLWTKYYLQAWLQRASWTGGTASLLQVPSASGQGGSSPDCVGTRPDSASQSAEGWLACSPGPPGDSDSASMRVRSECAGPTNITGNLGLWSSHPALRNCLGQETASVRQIILSVLQDTLQLKCTCEYVYWNPSQEIYQLYKDTRIFRCNQ